jgi:integrase
MASVDKRPNGKWRARWREYPGGPQRARHFARKIDAERFLVDVQHRLLSGVYTSPAAGRITVAAYADEWLERRRRRWRAATFDRYERELRLHIVPTLGGWPLANLRREHVEAWVAELPLAPSSSALVAQTLSSLLASAVEDGRIPRNPVTGAKLPSLAAPPVVPLTVEQIRRLASAAVEHVRAAVVVVAGTGLRQGELFGLTVDRIDFLRRELRVDQQLWTPKQGPAVLAPVKSRNSYRTVGLGQVVTEALAAHLASVGPAENGVVFHVDGRPIARGTAWKYASKAGVASGVGRMVPVEGATDRARYDGPTWHDLRHHHASVLLSRGVSPALVAERLGHDIKTLMRTYAHVIRSDEDRVRSIVDDSLGATAEDWLRTA